MPGDVLSIGRGTRAVLRSENPAVSLDHATITRDEGGYTITDLGSITGTYVNGRPVESMRLAKTDVVEIGDLRLEVQSADPRQPLILRVAKSNVQSSDFEDEAAPAAAKPGVGSLRAPKIDYASEYRLQRPYLTKLAVTAALAIFCIGVIGEITKPQQQKVFAPGGVSSAHARFRDPKGEPLANDCQMCHEPFLGVTDSRCEGCHGSMVHAKNQDSPPPCTECHAEHRGQGRLAVISDKICVDCHGNIAAHMRQAKNVANVVAFGADHPEFTYPPDNDTVRFNHRLHLKKGGLFNAQGMREEITCTFCHGMFDTRGRVDPTPVKFVEACQHCHRLTFDPRFPDIEVPHGGDPGNAYGFILATYAGNRDIIGKSPEELRRILTQRRQTTSDDRALLDAEQVIKVKCGLCHEIRRGAGGRPVATPPVIPARWLEAKFSHGPHRTLSCDECHAQAVNSTKTSDVLMPERKACVGCHAERSSTILASTRSRTNNCVLCHEYHVHSATSLPRFSPRGGITRADVGGGSGMLLSILFAAAVILLLVVFVPVGIALYQRMRGASRQDRAPNRSTEPIPPLPPAPTSRVPAITPDRVGQAPPPVPPPEDRRGRPSHTDKDTPQVGAKVASTRLITPEEVPGHQATEAMVWFGMLRCTAGKLEGQTFVVEEDGLYIGRDPTLSKIVVDDSRVSKRHVRIIPRDGKVWAIDQSSTNGTFVVSAAGRERITEHQLKRGESIVLADEAATFIYQI